MTKDTDNIGIPHQERSSTGIEGLDDILGGGLPTRHLYLVEGTPGSGKTTLGLQFLRRGAEDGEKGLYITLSETAAELRTVAASHGWSLKGVEVFELVTEEGLSPESQQSILHPSEVELGETTRGVMAAVERLKPKRVVFDSLSEMRLLAQNPLRYRRQVLALKGFFANRGCTVLLLDDRSASNDDLQLHSIAHGVISVEQLVDQYGPERRHLRVVKMRGIRFRGGEHDFSLETGGISVYPRLIAAEHRSAVENTNVSTGTAALDRLLGGGLARGTSTLFSGPSGCRQDHHGAGIRSRRVAARRAGRLLPVRRGPGDLARPLPLARLERGRVPGERAVADPHPRSGRSVAGPVRPHGAQCRRGPRRADRGDRQPQCLHAGDDGRQAPAAADARAAHLPEPARHRLHPHPRACTACWAMCAPMST